MLQRIEHFGETWPGMLVLIAIPPFIVFLPVLLGRAVFTDGFSYVWAQQFFYFYKSALVSGDSILWNPLVFSGFPAFASITGGAFSPLAFIFFKFLPVQFGYNWLIFLHTVLAGFFTAFFLRRLGISVAGSYIGGMSFMFNFWYIIPDMPFVNSRPYLPLFFIILFELGSKRRLVWLVAGILITGLGWFSAQWQYFIEIIFVGGLFALYLAFFNGSKNIRVLFDYLLMVAGGALIGSMQLIPSLFYSRFSLRGAGYSPFEAASGGILPIDLFSFFLPHAIIPSFHLWPKLYLGAFALLFFILAFRLGRRSFTGFFSSLALFSFFLSVEKSPLFAAMSLIPPFNLLHGPDRWSFIIVFSAATLSGFGFDTLSKKEDLKWAGIKLKIFGYLSGIITFGLFLYGILILFFEERMRRFLKEIFRIYFYRGKSLPLEQYFSYMDRVLASAKESLYFFSPKVFIPFIFLEFALVLTILFLKGKMAGEKFRALVLTAAALNGILVFVFADLTTPSNIINRIPQSVEFLMTRESGRVLPVFMAEFQRKNLSDNISREEKNTGEIFSNEALLPNRNTRYGLESADYFDELMTRRMSRFLSLLRTPPRDEGAGPLAIASIGTLEDRVSGFGSRSGYLDFLGVRYALSPYPLRENGLFHKIYEKNMPEAGATFYIYENNNARPRFYFADKIEVIDDAENVVLEKLGKFNFENNAVFIECGLSNIGCSPEHPMLLKNNDGQGEIEIKTKKNTVSILKTKSETPQFLVFSENHLPGWKAYIDGEETPIYTVGSVYMGVLVPEREHEVKFEFTYRTIIEEFLKKYF